MGFSRHDSPTTSRCPNVDPYNPNPKLQEVQWLRRGIPVIMALLMTVCPVGATAQGNEIVVRVDLTGKSPRQVEDLLSNHPDILGWGKDWADIIAEEAEVAELNDAGFGIDVRIPNTRVYEEELRERDYFDHFHDYQEIVDEIQQVEVDHPSLVQIHDIGDGWEKTEGMADRDIWAVKISDNVETFEREEPEVLIMSNIHAREIITPEITIHLIHYLTDNYGTDPRITSLVDQRQIWIVPSVNPDGLDYVHYQDIWWRNNRRDNGDGTFGVDLNRNFGYMWGYDDIGSSPNTGDILYRGTAPFSEPESQAIRDLAESRRFILSLSYHSYSNWWLYPWGYIAENTPDHDTFVAIAESCAAYNGYEPGNPASGTCYVTNGNTDDWFYGEQSTKYKMYGFTPEVGGSDDGFHPDTTRIEQLILENLGANLYVIEAAEEYSPRPVIAHDPLPDTEDIIGPYRVVASISSPLWPIDQGSLEVHYSWNDGTFETAPLVPTGQADECEGWIPGPGRRESGCYGYFLTAADSIPRIGYCPPDAPDSLFSFAVGLDSIPPGIVHAPLGDQSTIAAPFPVVAEVTDNVAIDTVWIEFRINQGSLVIVPMVPQCGSEYLGWIDAEEFEPGDIFDYRIGAKDATVAGNTAYHPDTGFHSFLILEGYAYDFEPNDGGFVSSSGSDWEWGIPASGPEAAYSGQNVWATNLAGSYSSNSNATLDTPEFPLLNVLDPVLTFWHWYEMEYSEGTLWDGGNVKISTDGGETFELIYPEAGYDGIASDMAGNPLEGEPIFGGPSENSALWQEETFDLSEYVNRTVMVRFHFGSDDVGTDQGWYLDDFFLSTVQSDIPLFTRTTLLAATADTIGPYQLTSEITDDEGVTGATLYYCIAPDGFTQVPMQLTSSILYSGDIPGQSHETTVEYYLGAVDTDGNASTDPPGAPDSLFSFLVTDSFQQIGPLPASVVLSVEPGESTSDTLIISNLGLIDLVFSLSDTAAGDDTPGTTEVVVDEVNDAPAGCPDICSLWATKCQDAVELAIEFNPGWPEACFALISLDIDQDPSTGAMPPGLGYGYPYHDIGSEIEIVFDVADYYGAGAPTAHVFSEDGTTVLGTVSLTIEPEGPSAVFPLELLNDDGNMNVSLLALADISSTSEIDFAPEIGHGVIGKPGDALWLSETPDSGVVPGEGSVAVELVADATNLPEGRHQARLVVATNDPSTPTQVVNITFDVGEVGVSELAALPKCLSLSAYPNPFSDSAVLDLGLPSNGVVTVRVYNILGQRVCTLIDREMQAGWHSLPWDGKTAHQRTVANGVYFCKIETSAGAKTVRIVRAR
jgi:hypothetical protein